MDISNLKTLLSLDNRDMGIVIGLYLSRFNKQALDAHLRTGGGPYGQVRVGQVLEAVKPDFRQPDVVDVVVRVRCLEAEILVGCVAVVAASVTELLLRR